MVTLVEAAGDVYEWAGEDTPVSYDANGWLIRTDDIGLNSIPDGRLVYKQGNFLLPASAIERADRIEFLKTIQTPIGSVVIGNLVSLTDAGQEPSFVNRINDNRYLFVTTLWDETTGSTRPTWRDFSAQTTAQFQPDGSESTTANSVSFSFPGVRSGSASSYTLTGTSTEQLRFRGYIGADDSTDPVVDQLIPTLNGDTTFSLDSPFISEANQMYFIVISSDTNTDFTIQGANVTLPGMSVSQFIPRLTAVGQDFTERILLDASSGQDISNAIDTFLGSTDWRTGTGSQVQSNWNEVDTNSPSFIQNKPTLAPSNAEQNVQSDWNETNSSSDAFIQNKPTIPPSFTPRTDEEIRDVVGSTLVAGSNITITVDDAADTITINSTGGGGGTTPVPISTDLRFGVSTEANPALVNFSSLTDVSNPTNPQQITLTTTANNQYLHIYTSNTHPITRIVESVLNEPVYEQGGTDNVFVLVEDVRTESTITYDGLTLGALVDGISKTYTISF